ncbi:hypothetical protein DSO57_1012468 [Entomophthora muscae]|uniref:Uncharacterized protein n=1 Tax=Entomophthora muscae TaxID=34485 RepID=A0ACC2TTI3_9FUNG|nr:hypothetical protein DSO57_1012468 [Entomophthora muscae]
MRRIHRIKVTKELKIHNKHLSSKQTPAATNKTSTVTTQTSATTKLLPAATTKLLHAANVQTPDTTKQMSAATKQMHTATVQALITLGSPIHKSGTLEPVCHQPPAHKPACACALHTPAASHSSCHPLSSHAIRPVHLHSLGKFPNQETKKGIFPKAKLDRNRCPSWVPIKWGMD